MMRRQSKTRRRFRRELDEIASLFHSYSAYLSPRALLCLDIAPISVKAPGPDELQPAVLAVVQGQPRLLGPLKILSDMASPLQIITRRLPSFISEPAIALISQECYTTLVYNTDFGDTRCLKLALSKVLGLGIVAGGAIVKVPQIIKIVRSKSARGLSLSSYLLDTASLILVVAYNLRLRFPFSTYGENVRALAWSILTAQILLVVQNVVITALILAFSTSKGTPWGAIVLFFLAVGGLGAGLLSEQITPIPLLRTLVAASIPLALSAKVPQIITNYRNQSTGQLSAFLVFNSLAGCLARVFTTATETGDATLFWSFASAAVLNAVIALQMGLYWKSDGRQKPDVLATHIRPPNALGGKGQATPVSPRTASTPKARNTSGQWQRKAE